MMSADKKVCMKVYRKLALCIVMIFMSALSYSQKTYGDTLFLMNGRVFGVSVIDTLFGYATFIDPVDTAKRAHVENDQLFAIKYQNGDIFYYYEQDTIANWFSREEMWLFMAGERDARKGFKARGSLYGSMLKIGRAHV